MKSINPDDALWTASKKKNRLLGIVGPNCCWVIGCCWFWAQADTGQNKRPVVQT